MEKEQNAYTKQGEWSGYTVRESKKGWIVEGWSRIQGEQTDYKYLVRFEDSLYQVGANLNAMHNDFYTVGGYIFEVEGMSEKSRTLRHGHKVH